MQVLYAKDTLNDMLKVKQSGTETISLFADTLGEIKEIRGFIYYPAQQSTRDVLADRISLMRYHAKDTLFKAPADSLEAGDKELKKEPVPGKPAELKRQSEEKDTVRQRSERRPRPRLRQTTEKTMKRFASHFLFLPAYGYLKQYAIETEEGMVVRLFPLTEEIENVEWLPGAIVLLTQNELKEPDTIFSLTNASRNLLITPPSFIDGSCGLMPVYFPNFDTTTLLPAAGTRHKLLR